MKLLFVSAFDYPTKYAHARHGLEMARAYYAHFGRDFLYLVNMAPSLPVPYLRLFGPFGRRLKLMHLRRMLVPIRLVFFFVFNPLWRSVVVATDPVMFPWLVFFKRIFGFVLALECHGSLTSRQARAVQAADLAIFTTKWLSHKYASQKSIVAPNAVDIDAFTATSDNRALLREELQLPSEFLIGYIGRFTPLKSDKGLRFLVESLISIPDAHLALVGGSRQEIPVYEEYARTMGVRDRVHFISHVDAALVPKYAKACDVLTYVPEERSQFFEYETSPMKVFEYMAAGTPMVLSDTPAIREIISEKEAFLIRPGSMDEFVHAIHAIQRGEGGERVQAAVEKIQKNTWLARAEKIVQALPVVV